MEITYGTLFLWTFGCTFHSFFDLFVWHLSACACCNSGGRFAKSTIASRCHDLGSVLLIPLVLGLLGLAGYSSYLRVTSGNASLEDEYEDAWSKDSRTEYSGTIPFWFGSGSSSVWPGLSFFRSSRRSFFREFWDAVASFRGLGAGRETSRCWSKACGTRSLCRPTRTAASSAIPTRNSDCFVPQKK